MKDAGKISPDGLPVIKKIHGNHTKPEPLKGLFTQEIKGKNKVVEYEPDPELRYGAGSANTKVELNVSFLPKCCLSPMPGLMKARPRSAMKSVSPTLLQTYTYAKY